MKILFVMLNADYIRNYESAIRSLAERGHRVHIGFNYTKSRKNEDINGSSVLQGQNITYNFDLLPERRDMWAALAIFTRTMKDYLRYLTPAYAHADKLRERMESRLGGRFIGSFVCALIKGFYAISGKAGLNFVNKLVMGVDKIIPADRNIHHFLISQKPDLILISPFIDFSPVQTDYAKSAKLLGIQLGVCVHSWDNLTNKGLMKIEPDKILLWNEIQKKEATEFHRMNPSKVAVTGAQCYDKWFERKAGATREEFFRKINLKANKSYILYLCSSAFIAPEEVSFVKEWIREIRNSQEPKLKEIGILIRPHFQNAQQWENIDFSNLENVVIWPRKGQNPLTEEARANFYDSIYHSTVVVGINTSAMIEAGILEKPVFTILDSRFKGAQEGTLHFHYLVKGGLLFISRNFTEHLEQLKSIMGDKDNKYREKIRGFIKDFVRPYGLNTPCTPILVEAIENISKIQPSQTQKLSIWRIISRVLMFPAALILQGIMFLKISAHKRDHAKVKEKDKDKKEWPSYFKRKKRNILNYTQTSHFRRLMELVVEFTPDGGRVLEPGCGTALLSIILADYGFEVTALDLDKTVLEDAKKRVNIANASLNFIQGDILRLDSLFSEKHFDTVCHSGVMEHFNDEDIVRSLEQQRKISRRVIFSIPNNRNKLTPHHFGDERFLSNRKWLSLIKKAGFKKVMVCGGYDVPIYTYFILPGAFFHRKVSFWWRYFSRHSIFVCEE